MSPGRVAPTPGEPKPRLPHLNLHWFRSLRHAREEIERWRQHYNTERPHSALGYRTPMEMLTTNAATALEPLAGSTLPLIGQFNPGDSSSPGP
jgi:putative transposase